MQYNGNFYFDKKSHSVTCNVNNSNDILLKVHENDINGFKSKISEWTEGCYMTIYDSRLINNGVGYYEYQSAYLAMYNTHIKCNKTDFVKNIYDFRFTFEPLIEWLEFKPIKIKADAITIEIPEDIILLEKEELTIKIKYFKENIETSSETTQINAKIHPYIVLNSKKKMSVKKVQNCVQLITRFFASLIGYTGNVNKIYFHNYYKGDIIFKSIENILIINTDFSNKYKISKGYSCFQLRTCYDDVKNIISDLFLNWYNKYNKKEYQNLLIQYFTPYNEGTIEEDFLVFTRVLEKISICKEDKKRQKKKSNEIRKILGKFYNKYGNELAEEFKNEKLRKDYIKDIDKIHEEIIENVVKKYNNRINLAERIKKIDQNCIMKESFEEKHIINKVETKNSLTVYDYINNTRNYYTHLDNNKNIIKSEFLSIYNRGLEQLIIKEILNIVGLDDKKIKMVLDKDQYLNVYNNLKLIKKGH